jgi:hypothetical protein
VNFVTSGADTPDVQHPSDAYFVRVDTAPPVAPEAPTHNKRKGVARQPYEPSPGPVHHRRRRRDKRPLFLIALLGSVLIWFAWASQRPGGVSGTINGWIDDMRGQVARVSSDPDLNRAVRFLESQYEDTGMYPRLSEEQLAANKIGVGVTVEWCFRGAVVVQGASGGGTVSRLLLEGRDLGVVDGRHGCPTSFTAPRPWALPSD